MTMTYKPTKLRSAEEWMNCFGKFPNDQKQEAEIYALAKLPENLLPRVAFWNSVLTELDIELIQINALEAAAEIVQSYPDTDTPISDITEAILAKIEELKRG